MMAGFPQEEIEQFKKAMSTKLTPQKCSIEKTEKRR
jgi:hypothetical protein